MIAGCSSENENYHNFDHFDYFYYLDNLLAKMKNRVFQCQWQDDHQNYHEFDNFDNLDIS